MLKVIRRLASLKITLIGMGLLGLGAFQSYGNPVDVSAWVLIVPLAILGLNLASAIITNSRINQQPGLLVFHVCLLTIVTLAGFGRLTHLDAHIELAEAAVFTPEALMDISAGPGHSGAIEKVKFEQGAYTVEYGAGMQRGLTHNFVKIIQANGEGKVIEIGDDRPLVLEKYRFYTTHNKGFTAIVTWIADGQAPITGGINMPSYPLFDYKQDNSWRSPDGTELKLWLQLNTGLTEDAPWVLDGTKAEATLVITHGEQRDELNVGDSIKVGGGELRYDRLSTWMGYRVFYDPTIKWMFFVSVAGVLGLMHYFKQKLNLQAWENDEMTQKSDDFSESGTKPGPLNGRSA